MNFKFPYYYSRCIFQLNSVHSPDPPIWRYQQIVVKQHIYLEFLVTEIHIGLGERLNWPPYFHNILYATFGRKAEFHPVADFLNNSGRKNSEWTVCKYETFIKIM